MHFNNSGRLLRWTALLLLGAFLLAPAAPAAAARKVDQPAAKAAQYLQGRYEKGQASEWGMIALASAGILKDSERKKYLTLLESRARSAAAGSRAATDYARLALAIAALGGDPANHGGVNLIEPLIAGQSASGKFADTIDGRGEELVNAHIWAIIALHSSGHDIPRPEAARRWLIKNQNRDGGFGYRRGAPSDADITAQALTALACLDESPRSIAVRRAFQYLQRQQTASGGFKGWGGENCESTAAVVQALTAWNMDPESKSWTKKGSTMISYLLKCQQADGGFSHRLKEKSDLIASEQALMALADYRRGRCFYLQMGDERAKSAIPSTENSRQSS